MEQNATFIESISITSRLDNLYDEPRKPARVSKEKLKSLLPKVIPVAQMKDRYPRTSELIDTLKESYWHFILRRVIFGAAETRRLQTTQANTSIRKLSGVHSVALDTVLAHFN